MRILGRALIILGVALLVAMGLNALREQGWLPGAPPAGVVEGPGGGFERGGGHGRGGDHDGGPSLAGLPDVGVTLAKISLIVAGGALGAAAIGRLGRRRRAT